MKFASRSARTCYRGVTAATARRGDEVGVSVRARRSTIVAVGVCAVLAGCSAPVGGAPVVHIVEAAKPSASVPLEHVLPTIDELAVKLGIGGFMGPLVLGGLDMLLQGVRESEATPAECIS